MTWSVMLSVKTVLKHGQDVVASEDWQGKIADRGYVAGALILSLDGNGGSRLAQPSPQLDRF